MNERSRILDLALLQVGVDEGSAEQKAMVDEYNQQRPLPRGYSMKYTDAWCAMFISWLFLHAGIDRIVKECGCQEMIEKNKDIFTKDTTDITQGDIVFYDWKQDGHSDHVGIVSSRDKNKIKVIEGNYNDRVGIREISIKSKNICGFLRPKYQETTYSKGWNKDHKGWWYSPDGETYYKDTIVCLPWSGGDDWFVFDSHGYMKENTVLEIDKNGCVKM